MKRDGVELEPAPEAPRDDGEVEHRRRAEAVRLVERERLAVYAGVDEVGLLRRGLRKIGERLEDLLLAPPRSVRLADAERLAVLRLLVDAKAVRAPEKRLVAKRHVAVEDHLRAVGVGQREAVEAADRLGMLLEPLVVDLDWRRLVLAEKVLQRVEVVLRHVAKPA